MPGPATDGLDRVAVPPSPGEEKPAGGDPAAAVLQMALARLARSSARSRLPSDGCSTETAFRGAMPSIAIDGPASSNFAATASSSLVGVVGDESVGGGLNV